MSKTFLVNQKLKYLAHLSIKITAVDLPDDDECLRGNLWRIRRCLQLR
jgi:hypothetical protein